MRLRVDGVDSLLVNRAVDAARVRPTAEGDGHMNDGPSGRRRMRGYLSAALAWLRRGLEQRGRRGRRAAGRADAALPSPRRAGEPRRSEAVPGRRRRCRRRSQPAAPPASASTADEQRDRGRRGARTPQPSSTRRRRSCSGQAARASRPSSSDVLLLCAALELDTAASPALCARAQGDPTPPYPTFALALTLFDDRPGTRCRPSGRCATGG